MAETALCRYACANCGTELEDSGVLLADAGDPADATTIAAIIDGTVNAVACRNCGHANNLPMPFFYHDATQSLLVGYVPGAGTMDQAALAEALNAPMSVVLGALLPDAAKSKIADFQSRVQDVPPDVEMVPLNAEAEQAQADAEAARQAVSDEMLALDVPQYLLQPTLVDNMEIMQAMLVAMRDGMPAADVMADLQRLQVLNALIAEPDPIARRRLLKHNENWLSPQLFEVIDTIREQAETQQNTPVVEALARARADIERYQAAMAKRDAAAAAAWAKKVARTAPPATEEKSL